MVLGPVLSVVRHASSEDNDPTGNLSGKGIAAKEAAGIKVFEIAKRSPDFHVCDYTIHDQSEELMRQQERKFPEGKRETREQFEARLDLTAKRLSPSYIRKSIRNLKERYQRCYAEGGGLFEEGGKKKKNTTKTGK